LQAEPEELQLKEAGQSIRREFRRHNDSLERSMAQSVPAAPKLELVEATEVSS
jgi:hypothetical protein